MRVTVAAVLTVVVPDETMSCARIVDASRRMLTKPSLSSKDRRARLWSVRISQAVVLDVVRSESTTCEYGSNLCSKRAGGRLVGVVTDSYFVRCP